MKDTDPDINKKIAKKMRMARKTKGLNLVQVGEMLHVSPQQAQKYETGATQIPFSKLSMFITNLGLNPGFFFDEFQSE